MENIILTNNKDLRLVGVKVGVLSTLRFELPLVSASATHVEVIVTSGDVHSAYTATFISDTKRWQCDIAASQFPAVGKQSYEIAYVLDGKQFWDGKGWIEIENATTSGIEPQPRPEPYRYAVVSVNGYGADAQGAVRIPKTFIAANSPETTEGYMEGDIYFNRETGATWTLCNVQGTLTWVFNYKNYYTKAETEEAIDRVAAYYITYDAAGNPFPTYAALANAQTVYSGGAVRVPTRNDYCVVLADETHDNAEYRYIYAVAEGQTTGSWQPQFPVEGVMTVDPTVTKNSQNPVSGGGVWSAIWGALTALPTGFTSLYDWVVAQLGLKRDYTDLSYDTTETVEVPALHSVMTVGGQTLAEYDLLCTEEVPDPPQIGHTYTWRADGAAFYVTQGVSALQTTWILYSQNGESLDGVTTQNATQGFYPDLDFRPSGAVVTIHKTTAQKTVTVEDELALKSDIPAPSTATPAMDGTGSPGSASFGFSCGNHVHPTDTSRMAATATGADIPVDATVGAQKINAALAGKADDNAVVKLSGNQIIAGNKTFVETTQFSNDVLVESGNLVVGTVGSDDTNFYNVGIRTYGHSAPIQYPEYNGLGKDFFALIQHIAPDYDGETSHTYAVNELRAYQGAVYRCMTAHTATAWVAANWALATVEDVLAALRTGKADVSALPYDRITITTGQLQDHAVQKVRLNAATTTLTLPALTDLSGKVSDFGIDMVNGHAPSGTPTAASFSLAGTIGTDYNIIVPEGEDWSEMSALAPNEMAVYYFTLSAFAINDKPTWEVMKKVVTLVPVPPAP